MPAPGHDRALNLAATLGAGPKGDEAHEWERARRDALSSLRSIPDPGLFAVWIEPRHREALRKAWWGRDGWRVPSEYVADLRLLGLVEVGGMQPRLESRNYLTVFGMRVRRVVMEAIEEKA